MFHSRHRNCLQFGARPLSGYENLEGSSAAHVREDRPQLHNYYRSSDAGVLRWGGSQQKRYRGLLDHEHL